MDSRHLFTPIYDVDEYLLLNLEVNELIHACQINRKAQIICNSVSFWKNKFKQNNLPLTDPLPTTLNQWINRYLNTVQSNDTIISFDMTTSPKTLLNFNEVFEDVGVIGRGTFGVIHLINDKYDNQYALKIFYNKNIDEYENEVDVLVDLSMPECHPNIICYVNHFIINDKYAILTDYIEGKTLEQYSRSNNLTVNDIKLIGLHLLDIVSWLHEKGYVHGDILTNNIIITNDGQLKLIDFGLAHKSLDTREDIYNIGRLLHVLLGNNNVDSCFQNVLYQLVGGNWKYSNSSNVVISAKNAYLLLLKC